MTIKLAYEHGATFGQGWYVHCGCGWNSGDYYMYTVGKLKAIQHAKMPYHVQDQMYLSTPWYTTNLTQS